MLHRRANVFGGLARLCINGNLTYYRRMALRLEKDAGHDPMAGHVGMHPVQTAGSAQLQERKIVVRNLLPGIERAEHRMKIHQTGLPLRSLSAKPLGTRSQSAVDSFAHPAGVAGDFGVLFINRGC